MVTKNNLRQTFCSMVLVHHLYVSFYTCCCLDIAGAKDEYVNKVFEFRARLFTTWNFAVHVVYFFCCVIENLLNLQHVLWFRRLRTFLFTTFVFPFTMFVFFMFWGLYCINRELVLPKSLDPFWPSWLNHSVHTVVFFVAIVELAIESQERKLSGKCKDSQYLAIACLIACSIIYDFVFLATFLEYNTWLYPVFGVLRSWILRILLLAFSNISVFGFYFLADHILDRKSFKMLFHNIYYKYKGIISLNKK